MSAPILNAGKESYLEIESAPGSGSFLFLCMVDSIAYSVDKNEENVTVWDCSDPSADATRKSVLMDVGETFQVSGKAATADAAYQRVRALRKVDTAAKFRWNFGLSTNGGKRLSFDAKVSNWSESKDGGAIVKVSFNLTVQDASVETALT